MRCEVAGRPTRSEVRDPSASRAFPGGAAAFYRRPEGFISWRNTGTGGADGSFGEVLISRRVELMICGDFGLRGTQVNTEHAPPSTSSVSAALARRGGGMAPTRLFPALALKARGRGVPPRCRHHHQVVRRLHHGWPPRRCRRGGCPADAGYFQNGRTCCPSSPLVKLSCRWFHLRVDASAASQPGDHPGRRRPSEGIADRHRPVAVLPRRSVGAPISWYCALLPCRRRIAVGG